jgi:hypothetical protein
VPAVANIQAPSIVPRPPLDPLVQAMPSAPSHASQQWMSFTQPTASSHFTTSVPSRQPNSSYCPFLVGNHSHVVSRSMNHHQPYFMINPARFVVRNPYAKSNQGDGSSQVITPQSRTLMSSNMRHEESDTFLPPPRRFPLRDRHGFGGGQMHFQPNPASHFFPTPNRPGITSLKDPTDITDSPFVFVPSQIDPNELEPNISYGPSSSSDSESSVPIIDLQPSPYVQKEKPSSPSYTSFTTAADAISTDNIVKSTSTK